MTEYPWKRFEVEYISIDPGQTLTVWMRSNKDNEDYRCVQVELRVTKDAQVEIYCDDAVVSGFKDWYKLELP